MNWILCEILDEKGQVLAQSGQGESASLILSSGGRSVVLTCGKPGSYCVIQLEDTLAPALVYLPQGKAVYQLPQGEGRQVYSPRAFSPGTSVVRARLAQPSEVEGLRNLALNPYDGHENKDMFPHAFANVETRGEAVFAARNAIDGLYENSSHGGWPYTSWGINRDPQAAWTIDFGRTVLVEKLRITLRADFPHDAWWTQGTVTFSDGSSQVLAFAKTALPQEFLISLRQVRSITFHDLIKADDPSPFPALTQFEVWGRESGENQNGN